MGLRAKKHTTWWCAICGEKYDWKEPNRLMVVQTGESVNQAKVFKAHAAPQGLCGNLINVLTLLANQQDDGDGLVQNIVTNLGEVGSKRLAEGLRNFTQVDNHRALEVGQLREGLRSCKARRPKGEERAPRAACQVKPRRIDAWSRGNGHLEVVHQCRPHCKREVE